MAAFNYTGWAMFDWGDTRPQSTIQYIDFCANTGTLRVWPEDDNIQEHEYLGTMNDHPAEHIKFLHNS